MEPGKDMERKLINKRGHLRQRFNRALATLTREVHKEARREPVSKGTLLEQWREADAHRRQINTVIEELRQFYEQGEDVDTDKRLKILNTWCDEFDRECDVVYTARAILDRHSSSTASHVTCSSVSSISVSSLSSLERVANWRKSVVGTSVSDDVVSPPKTDAPNLAISLSESVAARAQHLSSAVTMYTPEQKPVSFGPLLSDAFDTPTEESQLEPHDRDGRVDDGNVMNAPRNFATQSQNFHAAHIGNTIPVSVQSNMSALPPPANISPYEAHNSRLQPPSMTILQPTMAYGTPVTTHSSMTFEPQVYGTTLDYACSTDVPHNVSSNSYLAAAPVTSSYVHTQAPVALGPSIPSHTCIASAGAPMAGSLYTSNTTHRPEVAPTVTRNMFTHGQHMTLSTPQGGGFSTSTTSHEAAAAAQSFNFSDVQFRDAVEAAAVSAARAAVQVTSTDTSSVSTTAKLKLPLLKLPTFTGEILDWPEFWSLYKSTVHDRIDLAPVTKFGYLKANLKGPAAKCIAGLPVTAENYATAVDVLSRKFGKPEILIAHLYAKLQHLPVSSVKFTDIKHTVENIETIVRQLDTLGQDTHNQQFFVQQIMAKFPIEVTVWLEDHKHSSDSWTVLGVREALRRYVDIHENARHIATVTTPRSSSGLPASSRSSTSMPSSSVPDEPLQASTIVAVTPRPKPPVCSFCGGNHFNSDCSKYASPRTRRERLRELGRCFVCLRAGHVVRNCPNSQRSCKTCGQKGHHRLLCLKQKATTSSASPATSPAPQGSNNSTRSSSTAPPTAVNASSASLSSSEEIVLQTALIEYPTGSGNVTARILLDTGSHRSYISSDLVQRLGLVPIRKESLSVSTFGSTSTYETSADVVSLNLPLRGTASLPIELYSVPHLTNALQRSSLVTSDRRRLNGYAKGALADPPPSSGTTVHHIDMLIGLDYYWDIVEGCHDTLPSGLRVLNSKLGFILCGKHTRQTQSKQTSARVTTMFVSTIVNRSLSAVTDFQPVDETAGNRPNLSDLWRLDTLGIRDQEVQPDDVKVQAQFDDTVQMKDGRYEVRWPWKSHSPDLSSNYGLAWGRLKSLSKRFASDGKLLQSYTKTIQDQLSKGVIEEVTPDVVTGSLKHYLPHQPVLTPSKATTKLRIVYDASAKARKQDNSLNECLHRGPIRLPSLCGVLLRFRLQPIALTADVEKAFLQLSIHPEDRDVTRFLWYKDPSSPDVSPEHLTTFRFCRVPFGLICSPFLLEATVRHHLQGYDSTTAARILDNVYVDNIILGAATVADATKIFHDATTMFSSASMNLREWMSNSQALLSSLPSNAVSSDTSPKILGLPWDPGPDELCIPTVEFRSCLTKRAAVQQLCRLFDPLGWMNPVLVHAKLFLQNLWCISAAWDSPLPADVVTQWATVVNLLDKVWDIRLPRFICFSFI